MSKDKFTKGPWEIGRKAKMSTHIENQCVATVFPKGNNKDHKTNIRITMCGVENCIEAEANARLISAAPCLLEACKAMMQVGKEPSRTNLDCMSARNKIEQAIVKAEGEE